MKNKQGFTLVEIIVSIGLLALIGVAVGISLNKTFKKQEVKSYQEYVEKIKSSAMLYASNTVEIVNKLNSNASFQVITIEELINKGYISEKLENPQTKEKIDPAEKVKVYYNENSEMEIEYPYVETNEIYLYAMNFSVNYNENNKDLCYKDLNKSPFQLINEKGEATGQTLKANETIKAYLEDGTPCYDETKETSKIDTSKIGTYKIKYEYTIDGKLLSDATSEKKIIERTITVKPSKPTLGKFVIDYQIPLNTSGNDPYKAKLTLEVSDQVPLKYCLVPVEGNQTISDISKLITKCSETDENVIGGKWFDYTPNDSNKLVINLDLGKYQDIKTMNDIKFYVFVKNQFEEYDGKLNENNTDGIYKFQRKVILNAGESNVKNDKKAKFSDGKTTVTLMARYGTTFKEFINEENNNKYKEPIISGDAHEAAKYIFEGWKKGNTSTIYKNNSTIKITEDTVLTAQWYKYCSVTKLKSNGSCNASCGSHGTRTKKYVDSKDSSYACPSETVGCYGGDCPEPDPEPGGGGSSGGGESSGGGAGRCRNAANPCGGCYCGPGTKETRWTSNTGQCMCCCLNI